MTIITEAELRLMLGLASSITDEEHAVLTLLHPQAEGKVTEFLGYDPVQRVRTEYYPRSYSAGSAPVGVWDVNASHTQAQFESSGVGDTLQLSGLPVRSVTSLNVDYDARHGKASGAFGAGTAWTEGEDFWAQYEQEKFCASGLLTANGSWPAEPGTVKVVYRAGYSQDEFAGRAASDATASDGTITTAGVNAGPIRRAVAITVVKAMMTWSQNKKKTAAGFTAGALQSEKLGDYSYSVGGNMAENLAGMLMTLPAEAEECLEEFRNYGLMRL